MSNRIGMAVVLVCGLATAGMHSPSWAGRGAGQGAIIPAYYDHKVFTINLAPLPSGSTLLDRNGQTNNIWFSDALLPGGQPFVAVIDAIPTDGFNPLWAGNTISFTAGTTPFQIFSDDGVAHALAAGQITVVPTGVLFRCAIIGIPTASSATGVSRSVTANGASPSDVNPSAPHHSTWGRLKQLFR